MKAAEEWYAHACAHLTEGVARAKHPYHTMVVGTVNAQAQPELRTVVLRRFEPESRLLMFHTDIRSPKVAMLRANPATSLLLYHAEEKFQLRIAAQATIHHQDALCEAQWAATRQDSKLCYLTPYGSGEVVETPQQCGMNTRIQRVETPAQEAEAFGNLAVVACHYHQLDMVHLKYSGHERLVCRWDAQNQLHGEWQAI